MKDCISLQSRNCNTQISTSWKMTFILAWLSLFTFYSCGQTECILETAEITVVDTADGKAKGMMTLNNVDGNLYSFEWSTGFSGRSIEELAAGEYCVTVSEREGSCQIELCETVNSFIPEGSLSVDDGVLKLLFIGNSHTFYYDLPTTVERMLIADDPNLVTEIALETVGGYSWKDHIESGRAENFIYRTNWDYIVLQENAGFAGFTESQAETEIYPYARRLSDLIIDNNRSTKIILYMTHAYKNGSTQCDTNPNVCNYRDMQKEIRRNYIFVSGLFASQIAPAGMMWNIISDKEGINLHNADNIHPNEKGSQISAATITTTINGKRLQTDLIDQTLFPNSDIENIIDILNASLFDKQPDWRDY